MKTATRKNEVSESATPGQRLQAHQGLVNAKEKLSRLESERAAVQAKIDQHKASLRDTESLADKLLNGEPIELADTINQDSEHAKLAAYSAAILKQKQMIEQELGSASREICDVEAPAFKRRAEELIQSASRMISTFDEMEARVAELRNIGVSVDRRFPLFDGMRFRTILHQMKSIVGQYEQFVK